MLYGWLKAHNFSYKKPKFVPKNVDLIKQQVLIDFYEDSMNEASLEGILALFGDSVHPSQQVHLAYG